MGFMEKQKWIFALGFFDGVHLGHQALLRECVALARAKGARTAAITFDDHPMSLFVEDVPPLINRLEDRETLLKRFGMERIHRLPVTKEVMGKPWRLFLEELMDLGAAGFVCGNDFRFGCRGEGDGEKLTAFCRERGIPAVIVPEQTLDGRRISSTYIRGLIETGEMEQAARFLGHGHVLSGQVVPGRHLGHKLGFPTANVLFPHGVICPKHGVYACRAHFDGASYIAVTNVGSRPTVEGHQVRTESWVLDFDGDLYGREITLEFWSFLRPEQKFGNLEELKAAVELDARRTLAFFKNSEKIGKS